MSLRSLSVADLRRELARRERGAAVLSQKRAKLAASLATLDAELSDLGVTASSAPRRGRPAGSKNRRGSKAPGRKPGRKPGRATGRKIGRPAGSVSRGKNKATLADSLAAAIRPGTTVSPSEALQRVKAAGYKTNSSAFRVTVTQTLIKDSRFKRTGQGQYLRVGGAATGGKATKTAKPAKAAKRAKPAKAKRKASKKPGRKPARKSAPKVARKPARKAAPKTARKARRMAPAKAAPKAAAQPVPQAAPAVAMA
ncbi:MAG: hypothetical protein ACT4PU_00605 [Planctomycetota bacterium]